MISYLQLLARGFQDPLTLLAIAVDVIPVIFVVFFGWGLKRVVLLG